MLNRDNADGVAWGKRGRGGEALGDDEGASFALNMVGTSFVMAGEIERASAACCAASRSPGRGHELRVGAALSMLGSGSPRCTSSSSRERYLQRVHRVRRGARPRRRATRSPGSRSCTSIAGAGTRPRHSPGPCSRRARDQQDQCLDRARPPPRAPRRPGRVRSARRGARARAAGRPPAAPRPRRTPRAPRPPGSGRRRAGGRRGARRLRAGAGEAPPLVRGRARLLAVAGGRARRGAGLDRGAVPAPARRRRTRPPQRRGARAAARTRRRGRSPSRREGGARRPRRARPLGAAPARREACVERLGPAAGRARATRENPAGLTARELEVLAPRRRGDAERGDRRAARALDAYGRPPRLRDPAQARRAHARRGGAAACSVSPKSVARRAKMGNPADVRRAARP